MVRCSPAVELLPLRGWWSWRRGCLLPVLPGNARCISTSHVAFLHLTQGLAGCHGNRRGPALAAVEAEVVFGHGSTSEIKRSRRRCKGVAVVVIGAAVRVSEAPSRLVEELLVLTDVLWRSGLPPPTWVVPLGQAVLPVELARFLLPGGIRLCRCVALC